MPDLLLELFSEEIPARMQRRAAEDLKRMVTGGLVDAGLHYEGAKAYATPRRLALHVTGVPARSPDLTEERKGPRVGAPEAALQGFLKAAGLASIDQASVVADPKKGEFYVARVTRPGRAAIDVLSELIPAVVRDFPWPKSQRWGSGSLRWVRPLHSIVCTFGPETEEPDIVPFEIDGIHAGNTTYGHRFMAPAAITVKRFEDYVAKLQAAYVVLDPDRRKDIILHDAKDLALAHGLELVEDEGLVEEVAGLVEWPVVLMGSFDERFLAVPAEVIRATIRANQKCFVLRSHHVDQKLAGRFIMVANILASDDGREIVAGNGRVVRARLADARHFFETDQRDLPGYAGRGLKPLDQRLEKLKDLGIVFHEKLGTQWERIERIERLARELAPIVGADPDLAARAARLAKADLLTEVVGEFPEVQGLMGRTYALLEGENPAVATAIEDHYRPQGPSDRVPTEPVAVALALADKLDTLIGFWAIDEKPTGSKDPYQLRRAALGVIRILLANDVRLPLLAAMPAPFAQIMLDKRLVAVDRQMDIADELASAGAPEAVLVQLRERLLAPVASQAELDAYAAATAQEAWTRSLDLLAFFADRLKVQLRDQGARHDLVDAVFALGDQDDVVLIVKRVEALGAFLASEDGANLLAGYRRAVNIIRAEEKKDARAVEGDVDPALLGEAEELALARAVERALPAVRDAAAREDFAAAMTALAALRGPVDAFFDRILVNAPDRALRANRLRLLNQIREACHAIADFSRIEG